MLNIINSILWILALYGLIEIIKTTYCFFTYTKLQSEGIYFIIAVKNQEEKIEGFLRTLLFRILYGKEDCINNIIVADLGSTDNTKEIVKKLNQDYKFINLMEWNKCKELIEGISNKNNINI